MLGSQLHNQASPSCCTSTSPPATNTNTNASALKKSVLDFFRELPRFAAQKAWFLLAHSRLAPSFARGTASMPCRSTAAYCKVLTGSPLKPCNFHAGNSTRSIDISDDRAFIRAD